MLSPTCDVLVMELDGLNAEVWCELAVWPLLALKLDGAGILATERTLGTCHRMRFDPRYVRGEVKAAIVNVVREGWPSYAVEFR